MVAAIAVRVVSSSVSRVFRAFMAGDSNTVPVVAYKALRMVERSCSFLSVFIVWCIPFSADIVVKLVPRTLQSLHPSLYYLPSRAPEESIQSA